MMDAKEKFAEWAATDKTDNNTPRSYADAWVGWYAAHEILERKIRIAIRMFEQQLTNPSNALLQEMKAFIEDMDR